MIDSTNGIVKGRNGQTRLVTRAVTSRSRMNETPRFGLKCFPIFWGRYSVEYTLNI